MRNYEYDYGYSSSDVASCIVLHSKRRTARKDHICSLCGKPIPAGTTYMHEAHIYDGDFEFVKYHHRYCTDD